MIEEPQVFHQISSYIIPEDFTGENYRKVAELLYQQYEEGEANPARILDHFTEGRGSTGRQPPCSTPGSGELTTPEEREKALKETMVRVKAHSIGEAAARLDPTDIRGLQRLMEASGSCRTLRNCIFLLIRDKYNQAMEDGNYMEENMAKFEEKLKELVALGKKKKSVLELQEINDFLLRHGTYLRADGEGVRLSGGQQCGRAPDRCG